MRVGPGDARPHFLSDHEASVRTCDITWNPPTNPTGRRYHDLRFTGKARLGPQGTEREGHSQD